MLHPPPEINLKQQLVDQLEKAQKNLMSMKHQYEDKMNLLQRQIKSVESERDKVLKEMGQLIEVQGSSQTVLSPEVKGQRGANMALSKDLIFLPRCSSWRGET